MTSFVVCVLLEGIHTPELPFVQQRWMECVVLLPASSADEACNSALEYVTAAYETSYESLTGDLVRWKTKAWSGVWPSEIEVHSPTEIFSRFLRASEGESMLLPFED